MLLTPLSPLHAQIDPVKRRLIQLGYNQHLEGSGPIAGYGFYYDNRPGFPSTNQTLRLAVAPIYLDAELGFRQAIGPNTDFALGLAGGGFADSYSEIRQGDWRKSESFTGHGGEVNASLYHIFNPASRIPLWFISRFGPHYSVYERDSDTADAFEIPPDGISFRLRSGLRYGGQEPNMGAPLAMELSVWHEALWRTYNGDYGFAGDRSIHSNAHQFWARALLKYTFDNDLAQWARVSLTAGTSVNADRLTTYRLGAVLPFAAEFRLDLPGYYFHEISATDFVLFNGEYGHPIDPNKRWWIRFMGAIAAVNYLDPLSQPGNWHSGLGIGATYTSPSGSWIITALYGRGFNATRDGDRGANSVGVLLQYDFEAKGRSQRSFFEPAIDPYKSRGGERWFRR